jgi:hypothetical protein
MPHILVVTDDHDDGRRSVVYRERISASDLESDHFSGQLVERVSWAVRYATELTEEPGGVVRPLGGRGALRGAA